MALSSYWALMFLRSLTSTLGLIVLFWSGCCDKRPSSGEGKLADSRPARAVFIPSRCGFSGSEGTAFVSDLDEAAKHPIVGMDAYFEAVTGFGEKSMVGVQLRRNGADPVLIGRSTGTKESIDLPDRSFVSAMSITVNWGRKTDLTGIAIDWRDRVGNASGKKFLGTRPTAYFYYYRDFPSMHHASTYEITGIEGYVSKDKTLRSLGVVRGLLPDREVATNEQMEGPCGRVGGVTSATDYRKLVGIRLWSDPDGLYGVQVSHARPDGSQVEKGRLFGVERGAAADYPLGPTEFMSAISGKVDSTGVRLLVIDIFDFKTLKTRRIRSAVRPNDPNPWKDVNDFMFNLPKAWSPSALVPTARIYGFHGWVDGKRVSSIGPFYATTQRTAGN